MTHRSPASAPDDNNDAQKPASEIQPLEWAVAIFGACLVVAMLAYLIYVGLDREQSPPDLRAAVDEIITLESSYLVTFDVFNQGEQAAIGAVVQGVLRDGDTDIETSEATLDYVPAQSRRSGGLYFTHDPQGLTLALQAKGYQRP